MYGVAATRRRASGTPAWVPENATAHLDFVNAQYWAGGSERSVASLLGGGFDGGSIDASGMEVLDSGTNRPLAIGAFFDALEAGLTTGMTIVFEFSAGADTQKLLLMLSDNTDPSLADWRLQVEKSTSGGSDVTAMDFGTLFLQDGFTEWVDVGTNKLGVTFSRDLGGGSWRHAASANGSAAVTQDVAYAADTGFATNGLQRVFIGVAEGYFTGWDDGRLRSITVYPAVDETALAILTDLPTA